MPKISSVFTAALVVSACVALVYAEEATPAGGTVPTSATPAETAESNSTSEPGGHKPSPKPGAPAATPARLPSGENPPTPTPKPRRRSFFEWLFGSHKHKDQSTPVPGSSPIAASPTPAGHKAGHKSTPTPTPEPSLVVKPSPTPKKPHGSQPEGSPKPEKATPTPKPDKVTGGTPAPPPATPVPRKTPKPKNTPVPETGENKPLVSPGPNADDETKEVFRFDTAKTKALEDPEIKALKDKADLATTDEDSRAALRAYNKKLFEKIKKIDPGVSERADQLLKAILKRLE